MDETKFCRLEKAYPHMVKKTEKIYNHPSQTLSQEYVIPTYADQHLHREYENNVKLNQVEKEIMGIKEILSELALKQSKESKPEVLNKSEAINNSERITKSEGLHKSDKIFQSDQNGNSFLSDPTNVTLIRILIITGIILLILIGFALICAVAIGFSKLGQRSYQNVQ